MSCCGGSCCCCGSCGCGVMFHGFAEENNETKGRTMVLDVSPEKGSIKASENATESGEAGHGCGCGSSCKCSPCSC